MGIGNHELIEFEERNYDDLREEFIKDNEAKFSDFVLEKYNDYNVGLM